MLKKFCSFVIVCVILCSLLAVSACTATKVTHSKNIDKNKVVKNKVKTCDGWVNESKRLFTKKNYKGALSASNQAINLNQSSFKGWLYKSKALFALKRYNEALSASNQTLKLGTCKEAWSINLKSLLSLNNYSDAFVVSEEALKVYPNDSIFIYPEKKKQIKINKFFDSLCFYNSINRVHLQNYQYLYEHYIYLILSPPVLDFKYSFGVNNKISAYVGKLDASDQRVKSKVRSIKSLSKAGYHFDPFVEQPTALNVMFNVSVVMNKYCDAILKLDPKGKLDPRTKNIKNIRNETTYFKNYIKDFLVSYNRFITVEQDKQCKSSFFCRIIGLK